VLLYSCNIVPQGDEAQLRQRLIMDDNEAFLAGGGADEAGDEDWDYGDGEGAGEQAAAAGQSIEPQDLAMDDDELQYDGTDQQYDEQYNVTEQQHDDSAGGNGEQLQHKQGGGEEEYLDYGGEDLYENGDDEERLLDDDQAGPAGGYAGADYGEGEYHHQQEQYAADGEYEGLDEASSGQQQQRQMNGSGSGPVIGDLGSEDEDLGGLLDEEDEDDQPAAKPAQQQQQKGKQPMPAPAPKQAAPQGQQQQQPGQQQQKPTGGPPKVRQLGQEGCLRQTCRPHMGNSA
jgi:hypothetical protein